MKISICIPTYNGEKFLRECLDSCITQNFEDFEIVVVDDGSTDKTVEICKGYQAKDSRIHLHFNQKNLGLVGNWNKCIELAKGEWIKFIFQDDYLHKDCLEKFWKSIQPEDRLIVSKRNFILPDNASQELKNYYAHEVRTFDNMNYKQIDGYIAAPEISKLAVENICLNFIAEPSLVMFKKDTCKEIGTFDANFAQICDLEFLQRLASHFGLRYLPEKLCYFRIHDSSTTSNNLGAKGYILSNLEPILLAHQMLFDANYELFRSHLNTSQFFKLKMYLNVRTYEAFLKSKLNPEHEKAFNLVADKYAEIKRRIQADLSTKLAYLLIQFKRNFAR
jgi:glycosyltransferase involved in cell wall biosynthesis